MYNFNDMPQETKDYITNMFQKAINKMDCLTDVINKVEELNKAVNELKKYYGNVEVVVSNIDCPEIKFDNGIEAAKDCLDGEFEYKPLCPSEKLYYKEFGYKGIRFSQILNREDDDE